MRVPEQIPLQLLLSQLLEVAGIQRKINRMNLTVELCFFHFIPINIHSSMVILYF
jgi:hypothetical protein